MDNVILQEILSSEEFIEIIFNIIWTIVTIIAIVIFYHLSKKIFKSIFKKNVLLKNIIDEGKIQTINSLLASVILFISITFGMIIIVTIWFGTISLGLATIGGVTLGVSLQNFIKDIMSGLMIMIEDQFKVGDFIVIDNMEGTVTKLTLRATQFKSSNGSIHIIPNSLITKITNFSKGPIKISVELLISNKNNIDHVLATMSEFCNNYQNPHLVSNPAVFFSSLKETSMLIKVTAFSNFQKINDIEQDLRINLKKLIEESHIELS